MDLGLQDKAVFIAGASRGIGFGMSDGFLAEGAKVIMTGRGEASLDEAKEALVAKGHDAARILTIAGDMTDTANIITALKAAENRFGPLHTVIANVGLGRSPLGWDVKDADWAADFKQNFTGSVALAREAVRLFMDRDEEARKGANLIFISSIAGVNALGTPLPYATSKAAINQLAATLAKQVGKDGIRVNAIAPGNIIFENGEWEARVKERPEAWTRWIKREVALRRFGTPEEIAGAACFLASSRAGFITGEVFVVDGGQVR